MRFLVREGRDPSLAPLVFHADTPHVLEHYTDEVLDVLTSTGRSVIVYEPVGTGFSCCALSFGHSVSEHVAALEELLEHLRLRLQAKLFVSCIGCAMAFVALACRKGLFSGFVVQQTPSQEQELQWMRRVDFKGLLAVPVVGQLLNMVTRRFLSDSWFRVSMAKGANQTRISATATASLARGAAFPLATLFQSISVSAKPRPTDRPVLALWALHDRSHHKTDQLSSKQLGPAVTVVQDVPAGHCIELDNPNEYVRIVSQWLNENRL